VHAHFEVEKLIMDTLSKVDIHSKLRGITPMTTKVHVIFRSFVVLLWMHDTIQLV
jgi:hypothetical protein